MSIEYEFDLICLGSGPASQRAAIQAAKLGKRSAVVERSRNVGGACVQSGTIPSKTFREAVRSMSRESVVLGLAAVGVTRIRPTMQQLVSRVQQTLENESATIREMCDRNDVTVLWGLGSFVDAHTLRIQAPDATRVVQTNFVFIGTGSRAILPPGVRTDGETIFTGDNILAMRELPRTMTVIGAGVIGMEYASMFAHAGVQVTVLDKADRPLGFVDREICDELMHQLRNARITFRLGEEVKTVEVLEGSPRRGAVITKSDKRIVSDVILLSAGRTGNVESLELESVGLAPDDRGRLKVDANYRTSVENIYAAGDLIGFPGLAATSYEQGRLAACHMFGEPAPPMGDQYPFGIYAIPEISTVGATEETLTRDAVPYEIGIARYGEMARGQIRVDRDGMLKLIFHRETRQLLGAHCIGSQATELIHIGQAVIKLKGGLSYFLETVFNYPTFAECYKTAALNALNRLKASSALDARAAAVATPAASTPTATAAPAAGAPAAAPATQPAKEPEKQRAAPKSKTAGKSRK